MKILWHRTYFRDKRFFAAFPSVVALPDGDILLAFRRAPDHRWMFGDMEETAFDAVDHVHFRSHVALQRLGPNLKPKGALQCLPAHPEAADQDANLFVTRSGRLIQYGFMWYPVPAKDVRGLEDAGLAINIQPEDGEGYLYWGSYSRFSDDGGENWSGHAMMPSDDLDGISPYPGVSKGAALRGRMVELEDGTLVVAGYSGKMAGHDNAAIRLYFSKDNGESWTAKQNTLGMEGVALLEPALANWPTGTLTAFCRTGGYDDRLVMVQSADQGQSFAAPETVDIMGHPHDPLVLPDGRLLLVYGYRHDDMGVRARLVADGQSIEDAEEVVIRDDSPSKDTGYPWGTQLPDGRILIVYYISDEHGLRGIEGTLVELT